MQFTWVFISFRVLNPGVYLSIGAYMSPVSIWINMVHTYVYYTDTYVISYMLNVFSDANLPRVGLDIMPVQFLCPAS